VIFATGESSSGVVEAAKSIPKGHLVNRNFASARQSCAIKTLQDFDAMSYTIVVKATASEKIKGELTSRAHSFSTTNPHSSFQIAGLGKFFLLTLLVCSCYDCHTNN